MWDLDNTPLAVRKWHSSVPLRPRMVLATSRAHHGPLGYHSTHRHHVRSVAHRWTSPLGVCAVRRCAAWGIDWFARVAPGKNIGTKEAVMPRAQIKDEKALRDH